MLEVKDLHITFSTPHGLCKAASGVSYSVAEGETVAIVGESGSGKTVSAQAIMGLLSSGQIQGEIFFEKENLLKKSRKEMESICGKQIGMIFQDPMSALNPTMRIGTQIGEALHKHLKLSKKEAENRVLELLHDVGIAEPQMTYARYPHELSGGMRQRVLIATALACNPRLLIADEPTTALDVTIQAQILQLMKDLQAKRGMAILLITHDLGVVARMSDRVVVMYGGKVVETAPTEALFASPQHPYTAALLRSIPRLDGDRHAELIPIEGSPPNLLNPPPGCPFWPRCPHAMPICQKEFPPRFSVSPEHSTHCWLKE